MAYEKKSTRTWAYVDLALACRLFKGNDRLVLIALACRVDTEGSCNCGYKDIGQRANCERKAVKLALKTLCDFKIGDQYLLVRRQPEIGRSNHYRLSRSVLMQLARKVPGWLTKQKALTEEEQALLDSLELEAAEEELSF
jgi:hypothetical protein